MNLKERKYNYNLIYFFYIAIIFQILPFTKNDSFSLNINYLFIIILNLYPLYFYLINFKKIENIPFFYLSHLYFFLSYTLAIIYDQSPLTASIGSDHDLISSLFANRPRQLMGATGDELMLSLKIYTLALLFFNFGYFLTCKYLKLNKLSINFFNHNNNYNFVLCLGLLAFTGYLLLIIFKESYFFNIFNQIKTPLLFFYLGCFYIYLIKTKTNIISKIILIILIIMPVILEILSGLMTFPFLIIFYLYLLNFLFKKKLYLKTIIILTLIFLFLNSHKHEYRSLISFYNNTDKLKNSNAELNTVEKFIKSYNQSIKSDLNSENSYVFYNYLRNNLKRLFHSYNSLIVVTQMTPIEVPYYGGESYIPLITKFIPRVLWPDKPTEEFGSSFGKVYKILNVADKQTSWNMPVINEFYANFGKKGVIIGMFLVGILLGLINVMLNFNKENLLFLITYSSFYPIFYMESNLSLVIGVILQKFIFLILFIFLVKIILKKIRLFNL